MLPGVVDSQFLLNEIKCVSMTHLDGQVEIAAIFFEGLVYVQFVNGELLQDLFLGRVTYCPMKYGLASLVLPPEINIAIQEPIDSP